MLDVGLPQQVDHYPGTGSDALMLRYDIISTPQSEMPSRDFE
jgi:hypothetical protein